MKQQNWFVAYTYPKAEKKVSNRILEAGFDSFLPLQKVRRVWSDRIKYIEEPLFSSYVFVKTDVTNLPRLTDIHGLSRFIAFQGEYAKVKEKEIKMIQKFVTSGVDIDVFSGRLREKQLVRVKSGPFAGMEGLLVRKEGKGRFVVEIKGISQSISVNIPAQCLEVITNKA